MKLWDTCCICNKTVDRKACNHGNKARVSICLVGNVHPHCFRDNKEKLYQMSLAAPQREEREKYHEDTTEWMYHGSDEETVTGQLLFGHLSRMRS